MKAYKFTNTEDSRIFITDETSFENINACKAYNDYGQQVGCCDAGCYTLKNEGSGIHKDLFEALTDKYGYITYLDENISFQSLYEKLDFFNSVKALNDNLCDLINHEAIEFDDFSNTMGFILAWVKENENHTEIEALTVWNGSNHKTVAVLTSDFGYGESQQYVTELDEEESEKYLKAYEEHISGQPLEGTYRVINCEGFTISTSRMLDDWAAAWIELD